MIPAEKLMELDYEAAQSEKRDKLNSRLQAWSLLVALVSGFGLVSVQSGTVSYVVALFPLLTACIARYVAHSEEVLDQVKAYLLDVEQKSSVCGYESYNRSCKKRSTSGGHKKALRDAMVLMESLATAVVVLRLNADHLVWQAVAVLVIELLAMGATVLFLWEKE